MTRHVRDITTSNRLKKVVRKQGAVFSSRVYIDGVFEHLTEAAGEQNTIHLMDQRSRMATIRLGNALGDTTPAIKYELENNISTSLNAGLNSSAVLLDVNGTLVNSQDTRVFYARWASNTKGTHVVHPFGETSFGSYGKKRYQYTGKERDEETALYYFGARYYQTTLCRFVSVDPLAQKFADLSPYNYAGNKPIAKVDIDGLQEEGRPGTQQSGQSQEKNQKMTKATATDSESQTIQVHQVAKGETLSSIAKNYNLTVNELRTINNLNPENDQYLKVGQRLLVSNGNITYKKTITEEKNLSQSNSNNNFQSKSEQRTTSNQPVDLGNSENLAQRLIQRTREVLSTGGSVNDIIQSGTSVDEGLIDVFEVFSSNFFQTDNAYIGKFNGHPIELKTFGLPKDNNIHHVKIKNLVNENSDYKYSLRLQNVNNEDLLEFRFKSIEALDEVKKTMLHQK